MQRSKLVRTEVRVTIERLGKQEERDAATSESEVRVTIERLGKQEKPELWNEDIAEE